LRILLVHNFYGSASPSGENRVVEEERDMLMAAGYEVVQYFTYSDSVRGQGLWPEIRTALLLPSNPWARSDIQTLILKTRPDVMHVHNVFPLLSPAIFSASEGTSTAVVNTLHNYRTVCPNAMPLRRGVACTECIDSRSVVPALRYGCYRDSRMATLPLAISVGLHRRLGTYARHVDAFIALTEFQKSQLVTGGLPASRIHVKPNVFPGQQQCVPWEQREDKVVFLGRISEEKGVRTLVKAWLQWGEAAPQLVVIGDGPGLTPLRAETVGPAANRIKFLGALSLSQSYDQLSRAKLLVVPSISFECFPLVLREAFAFGVPVLASNLGTFEELVAERGAGRLFTPGDPNDLLRIVTRMWSDQPELERMAEVAHNEFQTRYTALAGLALLRGIYDSAIQRRTRHNRRGE
jgi:glycosyltransferase involved in cell wall biosynthesis